MPLARPTTASPTAGTPLAPSVPRDLVTRRRLLDRLRHGVDGPLTMLSAPAGYGKTTLVGAWLRDPRTEHDAPVTVAQLTATEADAWPEGFWPVAETVLRLAGVQVPPGHPVVDGTADRTVLRRLASGVLRHPVPVVWVLDAGEWLLPVSLGEGLHRLLRACAGRLRLVLLTRADPPMPLHRYRLEGAVTEIRAADLAFTNAEAAAFLHGTGLDVRPSDVAALQARTAGWPAGVRFAAMALADRVDVDRAMADFRGDSGNVAAYLMSEVLTRQPAETREFLLRTSLLDDLDPELVEVVTGQPCDRRQLQFMAQGNGFVEQQPGRHGGFRYHSLFREFLRSELTHQEPAIVPALHRALAERLAQRGQTRSAVRHAAAARAWRSATRILVEGLEVPDLLLGSWQSPLHRTMTALPQEVEGADPALVRAALAVRDLDLGQCDRELAAAERWLGATATRSPAHEVTLAMLRALRASLGGDLEDALVDTVTAEGALALLSPMELDRHTELRAVVAAARARVLIHRGDLAAARAALGAAVDAAAGSGDRSRPPGLSGMSEELRGMLALLEAMCARLRRATEVAAELWPTDDEPLTAAGPVTPAASLALAWVAIEEYDVETAGTLLESADVAASRYDGRLLSAVQTLLRARLLLAQGDPELAAAELEAARVVADPGSDADPGTWLARTVLLEQATLLLLQGRPEAVVELLDESGSGHLECRLRRRQAEAAIGRDSGATDRTDRTDGTDGTGEAELDAAQLDVQVLAWLVRTQARLAAGDRAEAESSLERALRLAAPEHLRRPFVTAPPEVRALLDSRDLAHRSRWLRTGDPHGDEVGAVTGAGEAEVDNPLTAKEQEVLGYLADLLTTDEIARTMFVSVNTVRSHVRSILRKLGVTRRNEAVRRAWELRLLPPRSAA